MTKYYIKWTANPMSLPKSPEEMMKLWQLSLEMTKADMKAGKTKDWGITSDLSEGYAIAEFANDAEAAAEAMKWMSTLNLSAKPVLTVDQCLEMVKKASAQMKK